MTFFTVFGRPEAQISHFTPMDKSPGTTVTLQYCMGKPFFLKGQNWKGEFHSTPNLQNRLGTVLKGKMLFIKGICMSDFRHKSYLTSFRSELHRKFKKSPFGHHTEKILIFEVKKECPKWDYDFTLPSHFEMRFRGHPLRKSSELLPLLLFPPPSICLA